MQINQGIIHFGMDYFNPFTKRMSDWTQTDKMKIASLFTIVIPLIIGCVTLLGYAVQIIHGKIKKELPMHVKVKAKEIDRVANPSKMDVYKPSIKDSESITTIFVAKNGLSQHSLKYQAVVGQKTNYNGKLESVHFASASCTPLAIAFALTARKVNCSANEDSPSKHLDFFLGDRKKIDRGILEIKKMIANSRSGVTIERMNLGGEDGLRIYNAMMEQQVVAVRTFNGNQSSYFYFDNVTNNTGIGDGINWHKKVLKDLKKGEGALVIFGGYSIGIRYIENAYEIFDSHNSNSYTGQAGACVIRCPNGEELDKHLDKIRSSGAAASGDRVQNEAQGIEIFVF